MTLDPAALETAQIIAAEVSELGASPKRIAACAITAYLAELSKTHVIVPREFDPFMAAAMDDAETDTGDWLNDCKNIWCALIAEIDGRNKADG